MHEQFDEVIKKLNLLRNRIVANSDSLSFRDFVKVKRELVSVKEEKEQIQA